MFTLLNMVNSQVLIKASGTVGTGCDYRRRMKTEAKAKVVCMGGKAEFIKLLTVLAILPRSIRKNGMNSTLPKLII